MTLDVHHIEIRKGETFTMTALFADDDGNPIDLTGYTARMQVREQMGDTDVLIDLTTDPDGGIILGQPNPDDPDPTDGTINVTITPDQTVDLTQERAVYDLVIKSAGDQVTPIFAPSKIIFIKPVTVL